MKPDYEAFVTTPRGDELGEMKRKFISVKLVLIRSLYGTVGIEETRNGLTHSCISPCVGLAAFCSSAARLTSGQLRTKAL